MADLSEVIKGLKGVKPKPSYTTRKRGSARSYPWAPADDGRVECQGCGGKWSTDMVTHPFLVIKECTMCAAQTILWRCFEEDDEMFVKGASPHENMTKDQIAVMSVNTEKACITLKCAYNPFFGERLKLLLRPAERKWNPDAKVWEIHPSKAKDVEQLLRVFYSGVQILGTKPAGGSKFERLLLLLKKEDKHMVYKMLALKYHPDKGGSHEAMTLINEIFKQA